MIRRRHSAPAHRPARAIDLAQAIRDYDDNLAVSGRAAKTRQVYALALGLYSDFLERQGITRATLDHLTVEHARRFILDLQRSISYTPLTDTTRRRSMTTIKLYVRILKTFATYAHRQGWTKHPQLTLLDIPKARQKVVHPFSADELRALLDAAQEAAFPSRNRALILLGISTGLRAEEIASLTIGQLDFTSMHIRVVGKGNKERVVQFDPTAAAAVQVYLNKRVSGPLFLGRNYQPLTSLGIYALIRRLGQAACIEHAHPHRMRHTFALNYLLAHPGAIEHLRLLMGHSGINQTHRYIELAAAYTHLEGRSVLDMLEVPAAAAI